MTEPTILVQEEFIRRIDSISAGLDDIKAELEEFKGQQDQRFEGVEQHFGAIEGRLGALEDGMVSLTDLVQQATQEIRAIGVAMEIYSIDRRLGLHGYKSPHFYGRFSDRFLHDNQKQGG